MPRIWNKHSVNSKEEVEEHSADEGIVEDEEEEGWSYDAGNRVMCLTQRTT